MNLKPKCKVFMLKLLVYSIMVKTSPHVVTISPRVFISLWGNFTKVCDNLTRDVDNLTNAGEYFTKCIYSFL